MSELNYFVFDKTWDKMMSNIDVRVGMLNRILGDVDGAEVVTIQFILDDAVSYATP